MTKSFSHYLDLIRFVAALAVFIQHLALYPFTDGVVWAPLASYGRTAVIAFFVLSGYVISYVSSNRENAPRAYFASRVSRLYSVILIALPFTFLADIAGMHIDPEYYSIPKVLWKPESWAGYISSLLFVNEYQVFGFNGIAPGTNGPYWSLSFEATYYWIAGLGLFFSPAISIPAALALLMLGGRTIAALFPIWLLGFFLYRTRSPRFLNAYAAFGAFVIFGLSVLAVPSILKYFPQDNFGIIFPWGRGPFDAVLIQDYFIALVFSVHLFFARLVIAGPGLSARSAKVFAWLGSPIPPALSCPLPADRDQPLGFGHYTACHVHRGACCNYRDYCDANMRKTQVYNPPWAHW